MDTVVQQVVAATVDAAMPTSAVAPVVTPETKTDTPIETQVETKTEEKPVDLSNKFAALTRATRQLEQERKTFRSEREKWLEEQKELAVIKSKIEKAKYDPMGTLESLGLKVDDIVSAALNNGKPDPSLEIRTLKEELAREKAEREAKLKDEETQRLLGTVRENIKKTIESAKESYELIDAFDASSLVFDVMANYSRETGGEYLPEKDACDQVEKYLEETYLPRVRTLKKLGAKLDAEKTQTTPETAKDETGTAMAKTLTNANVATSGPDTLPLDPEARYQAILKKYGVNQTHIG